MARTLHLNPFVRPSEVRTDAFVFTPHRRAALALGVPHTPIDTEARRILRRARMEIAKPLVQHRLLREAVRRACGVDADAAAKARALAPAVQTILRTDGEPDVLQESDNLRVRELGATVKEYEAMLRARHLVDPAEMLWHAARQVQAQPRRQEREIVLYGYFRPRVDEIEFVNAMAGDGSEFYLPCAEAVSMFGENALAVETLRRYGWLVRSETPSGAGDRATVGEAAAARFAFAAQNACDVRAYSFPNVEAEARGALAQIKRLMLEGTSPERICLAARDERLYGQALIDLGWEYDLPVRVPYEIPLTDTRLGCWLKSLLGAIAADFRHDETLQCLDHPFGGIFDEATRRAALSSRPRGVEGWQGVGVDLSRWQWSQLSRTRRAWAQTLEEAFEAFGVRRAASVWARELLAFNLLQEELRSLKTLGDEAVSFATFAAEVKELLSLLVVPLQPGRGGVELHAPQVLFGAKYEHVFLLGMAEGILPATVVESSVLDFYERKRLARRGLNLETAADVARREALACFLTFQTATETLTFSYPRMIETAEALPSPYFARMDVKPRDAEELPFPVASLEELRALLLQQEEAFSPAQADSMPDDETLHIARRALSVERRRESDAPPDEHDGVVGLPLDAAERSWSASQLTMIGQCSFRWFAARVLHLEPIEEAATQLTPALRGELYHRVLELLFKPQAGSAEEKAAADTRISDALARLEVEFINAERDVATKRRFDFSRLPAWAAQRREHLEILRRAIGSAEFPRGNVAATEAFFRGEWHGLKVSGYVDRVDRTPDGLVLVDYKTSSTPPPGAQDEEGRARLDIQLPLYIEAAAPQLFPDEKVDSAFYYSLTKGEILKRVEASGGGEQRTFADGVKGQLAAGDFAVRPDVEAKACEYCDFDCVCRRGFRLHAKRAASVRQEPGGRASASAGRSDDDEQ